MKTSLTLLRFKNKVMGVVAPRHTTQSAARRFLTLRRLPLKDYGLQAEPSCRRQVFCNGLSAARWRQSERKALLVHGWESRVTRMHNLVSPLLKWNFEVIAIDGPMHGHSNVGRANAIVFVKVILSAFTGLHTYATENLGHHKIVRSPEIIGHIGDSLAYGPHWPEKEEMAYAH